MNDTIEQELEVTAIVQSSLKKNSNNLTRDNNFDTQFVVSTSDTYDEYKIKPQDDIDLEIDSKINKSSLGPGLILKNMREEAKLSKDDIAKELRLSVRHVEHLENDQYDKFSALVFYLGNVRNYSRLLNLDPDKMIAKFHAIYKVVPENSSFKVVKVEGWQEFWPMSLLFSKEKSEHEKHKNITILISSFVVTVVFFVLWWLLSSSVFISNDTNAIVKLDNNKVMQLQPEQVDNLLPTQPVIVHNDKDKLETEVINTLNDDKILLPKKNKLDDYS